MLRLAKLEPDGVVSLYLSVTTYFVVRRARSCSLGGSPLVFAPAGQRSARGSGPVSRVARSGAHDHAWPAKGNENWLRENGGGSGEVEPSQ